MAPYSAFSVHIDPHGIIWGQYGVILRHEYPYNCFKTTFVDKMPYFCDPMIASSTFYDEF